MSASCDSCEERPYVVGVDWTDRLGLGLCVPCAHWITRQGLYVGGDDEPTKPSKWVWETTKVAHAPAQGVNPHIARTIAAMEAP